MPLLDEESRGIMVLCYDLPGGRSVVGNPMEFVDILGPCRPTGIIWLNARPAVNAAFRAHGPGWVPMSSW